MTEIINALWSLQTWFTLLVGIVLGLAIGAMLVAARRNSEEDLDGPPTILILPPEDPMPQVDVRGMLRRYE
jgi:hypothetical protein